MTLTKPAMLLGAEVKLDFNKNWIIVNASDNPVAVTASKELARYLKTITGRDFRISDKSENSPGAGTIVLFHGNGRTDAYSWRVTKNSIALRGDNSRGLLYGVYGLLEAMGCRWLSPEDEGEILPRGSVSTVPAVLRETPFFPGRCLIMGHAAFMDSFDDWVRWAARNRYNTIFIHVIPGPLALGAAPVKQWVKKKAAAMKLLEEYGMTVEYGGHGLSSFLPRKEFKKHPGMFRMEAGKRTDAYNFCPSSREGAAVIQKNAESFFREHPGIDVYHIWPDDILGGGWCSCELCKKYSPSEQALMAVNTVAEVLKKVNPGAQVSFLSYHDTEQVPLKVKPLNNVSLLWAPRKRCYSHSAGDIKCRVNRVYRGRLLAQVEYFRRNAAPPPRVFEYYLDAILFKSVLPPLATVMKRDCLFYGKSGVHTLQALLTGDRPWVTAQLNPWLYGRLAWKPGADEKKLVNEFCAFRYGRGGPAMARYYAGLERIFGLLLELSPEEALPERYTPMMKIFDEPPTDVEDNWFAPQAVKAERARRIEKVEALLDEASRFLEEAKGKAAEKAWRQEKTYFDLVRPWTVFNAERIRLYAALAAGRNDEARRHLERCDGAMEKVLAWSDVNIKDKKYRRNFRLMRLYNWQLRMDKIRADHFAPAWKRPFIRLRNMLRLGWLFIRLQRAFE